MPQKRILVIEGDELPGDELCAALQHKGWIVRRALTTAESRALLTSACPDVVLGGRDAVAHVQASGSAAKLIVVGDFADGAAIAAGAWYCLPVLPDPAALHLLLERACEAGRMERALAFYRERETRDHGLASVLGDSDAIKATRATLRRILDDELRSSCDALPPILIQGEPGSGRRHIARALHVDGVYGGGPFVAVQCASLAPSQLEADLLGRDACGQGLVAAAAGGTLYLDEIGACGLALQATLAELLSARAAGGAAVGGKGVGAPMRIVCSSSRDLEQQVREGRFRSDLYAMLCGTAFVVPPLRERGADFTVLARHFLDVLGRRHGKPDLKFDAFALAVLRGYAWPGNVRELRIMIEQTVLLAKGRIVTPNQLAVCPGLSGSCERDFHSLDSYCMSVPAAGVSVPDLEHDLLVKMLEKTDWNVTKSARLLGLSRDQLRYRIEKLGLVRPGR